MVAWKHGGKVLVWTCLTLGLLGMGHVFAGAKLNTYTLSPVTTADEPITLRVYNRQTHKLIWTRKASAGIDCYAWSRDHRALAVSWGIRRKSGTRNLLRFTLWQAGQKPRTFRDLPRPMGRYTPMSDLYTESLVEMVWSPDKRHLLIRSAASLGTAGNGMGNLWCVDTQRFKADLLVAGGVGQAKWTSNHTVYYREDIGDRTNADGIKVPVWTHKQVNLTDNHQHHAE